MMLNRRMFVNGAVCGTCLAGLTGPSWSTSKVETNDDGLHVQPWFMETFLDLREDHQEATAANKRFAVIWEQKGCSYCKEMHVVNFAKPEITNFIKKNFGILQLNLWGARKVTDFDGEEIEERDLASKWRVNFTPTIQFFAEDAGDGKAGADLEISRMPGYFKPFHFVSMFEYVHQKAYADRNFQRFLQDKFEDLQSKGIKADVW